MGTKRSIADRVSFLKIRKPEERIVDIELEIQALNAPIELGAGLERLGRSADFKHISAIMSDVLNDAMRDTKIMAGDKRTEAIGKMIAMDDIQKKIKEAIKQGKDALQKVGLLQKEKQELRKKMERG